MTKFAAYDDLSIYAVGDTPEAAAAKAREDANDPQAAFKIAPIADHLANQIAQGGWNGNRQSFEVAKDGHLVETTGQ